MTPEQAAALRAPFRPEQIGSLPKPYKKDSPKGKCPECGKFHGLPAAHLSYVGHAATTDRLLQVDPGWSWEPMAVTEDGMPKLDAKGGLWIRMTVCGVTRIGYGDETMGKGMKEVIGDALRNAAMRFGVALDLWSKEDLCAHPEAPADDEKAPAAPPPPPEQKPRDQSYWIRRIHAQAREAGVTHEQIRAYIQNRWAVGSSKDLAVADLEAVFEAVKKGEVK